MLFGASGVNFVAKAGVGIAFCPRRAVGAATFGSEMYKLQAQARVPVPPRQRPESARAPAICVPGPSLRGTEIADI